MAKRLAPTVSPDTEFFWNGLKEHKLLVQRCADCGALRNPPRPMCPECTSVEWDTKELSGRGTVYSFISPHYPPLPFMEYPYVVALIDLEEGIRLVSNLVGVEPSEVRNDMPVEVFFENFDNDLVLHQFRPARTEGSPS